MSSTRKSIGLFTLTDEHLSHLVYVKWRAPALFRSVEELTSDWRELMGAGMLDVTESHPYRLVVRISSVGDVVLRELSLPHLVNLCMDEGAHYVVERLIKRMSKEQLPEFLTFDSSLEAAYVRLFALERLEELQGNE